METLGSQNVSKMRSRRVSEEVLETVLYKNTLKSNPYTMYYVSCMSDTPLKSSILETFWHQNHLKIVTKSGPQQTPQKNMPKPKKKCEKWDYNFLRNAPRNPRNPDLEASWDPWRDLWCFRVLQDAKITSGMVPGTPKIHKKQQHMY